MSSTRVTHQVINAKIGAKNEIYSFFTEFAFWKGCCVIIQWTYVISGNIFLFMHCCISMYIRVVPLHKLEITVFIFFWVTTRVTNWMNVAFNRIIYNYTKRVQKQYYFDRDRNYCWLIIRWIYDNYYLINYT